MQMEEYQHIRHKINYKVIYLEEQIKLLDVNLEMTETLIAVLEQCQEKGGRLERQMYENIGVKVLRRIRKYLIDY
jgi:hypothetical protein